MKRSTAIALGILLALLCIAQSGPETKPGHEIPDAEYTPYGLRSR